MKIPPPDNTDKSGIELNSLTLWDIIFAAQQFKFFIDIQQQRLPAFPGGIGEVRETCSYREASVRLAAAEKLLQRLEGLKSPAPLLVGGMPASGQETEEKVKAVASVEDVLPVSVLPDLRKVLFQVVKEPSSSAIESGPFAFFLGSPSGVKEAFQPREGKAGVVHGGLQVDRESPTLPPDACALHVFDDCPVCGSGRKAVGR